MNWFGNCHMVITNNLNMFIVCFISLTVLRDLSSIGVTPQYSLARSSFMDDWLISEDRKSLKQLKEMEKV